MNCREGITSISVMVDCKSTENLDENLKEHFGICGREWNKNEY
jgi:hypothetical protein